MPRDFGPNHTDTRPDLGGSYRGTLKKDLWHPQLDNWANITPDFSKQWVAANEANRSAGNNGIIIPLTPGMPAGKTFDNKTGTIRWMTPAEKDARAQSDAAFARMDAGQGAGGKQRQSGATNQGSSGGANFLLSALQGLRGTPNLQTPNLLTPYSFSQNS